MTRKNLCMLLLGWFVAVAYLGSSRAPSNMGSPLLYIFFSFVAYSALMLAQEMNSLSETYRPSGVGLTRSPPLQQSGSVNINQDCNVLRIVSNSHTLHLAFQDLILNQPQTWPGWNGYWSVMKTWADIHNNQFLCQTVQSINSKLWLLSIITNND